MSAVSGVSDGRWQAKNDVLALWVNLEERMGSGLSGRIPELMVDAATVFGSFTTNSELVVAGAQ